MTGKFVKIKNEKFLMQASIARPRGNVALKLRSFLGFVFILLSVFFVERTGFAEKVLLVVLRSCGLILVLFSVELAKRCCLLTEEVKHLHTRYKDSLSNLFGNYIFEFDVRVFVATLVGLVLLVSIHGNADLRPLTFKGWELLGTFFTLSGLLMLEEHLKLSSGKLYDSIHIKEMKGLDYGSSMAHSYFHGYFKIVLPPDGHTSDNLRDLMVKYESDNNIKFQVYKLYILVPLSFHCPSSLMNKWSPSILESKTLQSIKRDRAGVIKRDYKISVYKIEYPGTDKPIYVCAEYANPLLTFRQAVEQDSLHSSAYREHKNDILWNFYDTTRQLLEADPVCRDLCELILYDDRDQNGEYIDVGLMLAKKIIRERMAIEAKEKSGKILL